MRLALTGAAILLAGAMATAQTLSEPTGVWALDAETLANSRDYEFEYSIAPVQEGRKSPLLAAVLSAILPGAGEIYNGQYLKGAIFLAAEATLIGVAVAYDQKGIDKTEEFEAYADEHWSAARYANWLMDYKTEFGITDTIRVNPDVNLPPWERIEDWDELNRAEEQVTYQGAAMSHTLHYYGEQQYYEMIGKYRQFSRGWADSDLSPEWWESVSPMMTRYSGMRGDANDYYNTASTAVVFIYVNHILSAIDAAWSAASINKDLAVDLRVEPNFLATRVEPTPRLSLSYRF
jgi:hypothetical protein